jgi:hypothetical protein
MKHLVLLGVSGPQFLERVHWLKELAKLADEENCPNTAIYLRNQAAVAEGTIRELIRKCEK